MTDTEQFSLKLSGTGISIDQSITKALATRIVMLVLSDGRVDESESDQLKQKGADGGTPIISPTARTATSLREFLNQHKAKKITEQIVAIGSYRQSKGDKNYFSREELDSGFEEAKAQPPGNPTRDIARVIALGWIAQRSGQKNQYYVTATGESAIEANFADHTKGGRGDRRRGKRAKGAKKVAAKAATAK